MLDLSDEPFRDQSVDLWLRDDRGVATFEMPAYMTDIKGLLVHRKIGYMNFWQCSHWSGYRIGGIFPSIHKARDAVREFFGKTKVDWTCRPSELWKNIRARHEVALFRAHNEVIKR